MNGTWDIEDSREAEAVPVVWNHKAPVPGLARFAQPSFPHVDLFDSRMLIFVYNAGVPRQERKWFWYHRTFAFSTTNSVAILRINKAQFGAASF
jgi:hypothetical protein